jgi:hypothetical protein
VGAANIDSVLADIPGGQTEQNDRRGRGRGIGGGGGGVEDGNS